MKKFWCLILICAATLLSVISFSGCSKKNQFNLGGLKANYETLADDCVVASLDTDKIKFDYSVFKIDDTAYLEQTINNVEPYKRLNDFYNPLLNNSMSFAYSYINVCSNSSIKVDESVMENLNDSLTSLKNAIKNVDNHIDTLAKCVKFEYPNPDYNSLTALKAVFDSYDELINSALNYNYNLSSVYFNNALTSAVDDYSKYTLENFDANKTMINFKSQTDSQILNLTRAYFNTYVRGNVLTETFVSKSGSNYNKPDENYTNYMSNVASISLGKSFEDSLTSKMEIINNSTELKQSFYKESVAMSNIQQIMANDLDNYQKAINDVVYSNKKSDPNATDYEKFCVQMIENHNYIVDEYSKVLVKIINIINNAGV
mgnify:FL=1